MIIATKGIVLRVVKYGDTSIICNIFTELLGLQAYLVKGVRSENKRSQKGNIFRPGNVLDLQVYHQQDKNINYIKDYQLGHFYQTIGENVIKNTVMIFAVDVLCNLVQTADAQEDLFYFTLDFFKELDEIAANEVANLPFFFLKESSKIMGYAISENYSEKNTFLNTFEGYFQQQPTQLMPIFEAAQSKKCYELLQANSTYAIKEIFVSSTDRKAILDGYLHFLQWHDKSFKPLKCLPVLEAILH